MCAKSVRASITKPPRIAQDRNAGAGLDRLRGDVAADILWSGFSLCPWGE
jgi:hypothetical protein